ncbi:MAG TPA: CRISPR-associated endonuclease Cas2 [Clostridiales bacterium]|jgi:CRISPR-associated protein Cas2|nr:CRISPR-associated endonuclease Cas2 [Clostridiales bacterium]
MRLILFFDLPTETLEDKRSYRKLRKALLKNGFIMMQESVYCKLLTTPSVENSVKALVRKNRPEKGLVQMLTVTEKQFSKMEFVTGEWTNDVIDTTERTVIL